MIPRMRLCPKVQISCIPAANESVLKGREDQMRMRRHRAHVLLGPVFVALPRHYVAQGGSRGYDLGVWGGDSVLRGLFGGVWGWRKTEDCKRNMKGRLRAD